MNVLSNGTIAEYLRRLDAAPHEAAAMIPTADLRLLLKELAHRRATEAEALGP